MLACYSSDEKNRHSTPSLMGINIPDHYLTYTTAVFSTRMLSEVLDVEFKLSVTDKQLDSKDGDQKNTVIPSSTQSGEAKQLQEKLN